MSSRFLTLIGIILAWFSPVRAQELSDAAKIQFFDQKVLGVLKENCFNCHGAEKRLKGHFRVTSRKGLLEGGDIGPSINLNEPEKSLLLEMISPLLEVKKKL